MNNSTTDADDPTPSSTLLMPVIAYPEHQAALMIWKIYPAILVVVGGFGNIASVCVMQRMKDKHSSQHAIFMALAISDLIFLCNTAAYRWIIYIFHTDIKLLHPALCKIWRWLGFVTGTTSPWLVTFVTVQRTMAVLWPHRMRVMCTVRRTWIVIAIITVIPCVSNSHTLVGSVLVSSGNSYSCVAKAGSYRYFFLHVYHWIDGALFSVIPFICQFICDILLSVTLIKAVSSASISTRVESNAGSAQNTDSRKNMSYRTTIMVLTISTASLILSTPVVVYMNLLYFVGTVLGNHPRQLAVSKVLHALVFQLWYTNSAINFFLYCLTGTKFRREFINWISCGVKSSSAPSVHGRAAVASKK